MAKGDDPEVDLDEPLEEGADPVDIMLVDARPGAPCFADDGTMDWPDQIYAWVHVAHLS